VAGFYSARRDSTQGSDWVGVDGSTEDVIEQQSRSRQPAVAGERAVFCYPDLKERGLGQ